MSLTVEDLLALPVGSVLTFSTLKEELTADMYDDEGKLLEGFTDEEILVRAGFHYFRDFVSAHGQSEFTAAGIVDRPGLKVLYVNA